MSVSGAMTDTKPSFRGAHPSASPLPPQHPSTLDASSKSVYTSPSGPLTVATPPPYVPTRRMPTMDLKQKLAAVLAGNGYRYWRAMQSFLLLKISRGELDSEAHICLKKEDLHLHNAFVLGILFNASSGVAGPSSAHDTLSHQPGARKDGVSSHYRNINGTMAPVDPDEDDIHGASQHIPSKQRISMLAASLPIKERQRIKASGKIQERSSTAGSNTSSWAGAGADLLEKRRKEEEKKSKEAERKRLREVHTEIGALDWTREALLEEATKQEVRAKLPIATLQALLRSGQVPLCIERRTLPEPEHLADLMTAQAVEAGLSGGVAPEASQLLVAGLQSHIRNVASSVITAIRANRSAGGVQLSCQRSKEVPGISTDSSADLSCRSGADESYPHSPVGETTFELSDSQLQGSASFSTPLRIPRVIRSSDQSSRTSTSSNNASTTASSIFTTGSSAPRHHLYTSASSGPDASVLSFASTAPTSVTRANSEQGSDVEMDFQGSEDRRAERVASRKVGEKPSLDEDHDEPNESMGSTDSLSSSGDVKHTAGVNHSRIESLLSRSIAPLPHRPLYSLGGFQDRKGSQAKLALRDVAFLLDLSPHVSVEPPGVSMMQRLLAPDVDQVSHVDDDDDDNANADADAGAHDEKRARSGQGSVEHWRQDIMRGEEERLALAARNMALAKHDSPVGAQVAQTQYAGKTLTPRVSGLRPVGSLGGQVADENDPRMGRRPPQRKNVVIDQQAALALLSDFDSRSSNQEDKGVVEGQEPMASLQSVLGKRQRSAPQPDPMADVVDTTQLLYGLCD